MKFSTPLMMGCCLAAIGLFAPQADAGTLNKDLVLNVGLECINDGMILKTNPSALQNQWYYSYDALGDGSGGSVYDIHGMAVRETKKDLLIVLNGNTPLTGNPIADGSVLNGSIGWGDLFLNLSGENFLTAMNQGQLYGIRFAETNDSGVGSLGLYEGVVAKSVTAQNSGYSSVSDYANAFPNSNYGDLPTINSYYDPSISLNVIESGTFVSPLQFLTLQDLQKAGYDSQQFGGSETIAFRISKSSLGDWPNQSVPEGSNLGGLAILAGLGGFMHRRGRQSQDAR